eukprot:TRINITY_DN13222_c0_g1_i7.p1 TRINITY_DN13222_c0_g1~~TRINITY_DN13222_c0_g1_i7.p1  ORF type:complete len:204 (-),score=41.33 TRINITY_DN13222_c0_g1_i7:144-683(-)
MTDIATKHPERTLLSSLTGTVMVPGDVVVDFAHMPAGSVLRVGRGLQQDGQKLVAVQAGRLCCVLGKSKLWIEAPQKRYEPCEGELVIGVVCDRHMDNFDVDVKGPAQALLPVLAFEGATRRNIPRLPEGSLVYGKVMKTHPDMSPEITCVDAVENVPATFPFDVVGVCGCSTTFGVSE